MRRARWRPTGSRPSRRYGRRCKDGLTGIRSRSRSNNIHRASSQARMRDFSLLSGPLTNVRSRSRAPDSVREREREQTPRTTPASKASRGYPAYHRQQTTTGGTPRRSQRSRSRAVRLAAVPASSTGAVKKSLARMVATSPKTPAEFATFPRSAEPWSPGAAAHAGRQPFIGLASRGKGGSRTRPVLSEERKSSGLPPEGQQGCRLFFPRNRRGIQRSVKPPRRFRRKKC